MTPPQKAINETRRTVVTMLSKLGIADYKDIEERLFNLSEEKHNESGIELSVLYSSIVYDSIAVALDDYDKFMYDLNNGLIGWNMSVFEEFREKKEDEINQLISEVKVKAGNIQCDRCKSWRITTTQKQTRSSDEGATNFYNCSNCGLIWTKNN